MCPHAQNIMSETTYDILELSNKKICELTDIAIEMGIDPDIYIPHKQNIIYAILDKQSDILKNH
jgi:hypothetical protein